MGLYIDDLYSCIKEISDVINTYVAPAANANSSNENAQEGEKTFETSSLGDKKSMFYGDIQNKIKDIYKALNLSAICGEYVDKSDFENKLVDIRNQVGEIITLLSDTGTPEESKSLLNVITCITRDLELYKLQVHLFWQSINNPKLQLIDYDIINEDNTDVKDNNIQIDLLSEIFRTNLNLVLIDREFSFHEQLFRILNVICHKLHEYKSKVETEYIDALLHKCQILLAKFSYKDDIDNLLLSYNYYNDKDEKVQLSVNGSICEYLKSIYTRDSKEYEHTISRLYDENPETNIHFSDFFVKCHYYKNIVKNEYLLSELIKKFETFQKGISSLSLFDKKNALSCLNYLNNCRLSFVLKQENITPTTVWHEGLKIKSVQDSTNIKNYFPFLKIAEWYRDYLSKQTEDIAKSDDLIRILHSFEENLWTADKYLTDSKHNAGCFIPFKPGYNECLEEYKLKNNETVKLFINSSFIVPVDYDKEEKRIDKLHSDLIRLKAIIEAHKSIHATIASLKESNKKFEQEIASLKTKSIEESERINNKVQLDLKDNQKSSVQILAIFAGIVIFASGTIQIFKGASNIKDATIFMLLFASALSIISLSIWLILTSKSKWDATRTIFCIILAIIVGLNVFAIWGNWGKVSIHTPPKVEIKK